MLFTHGDMCSVYEALAAELIKPLGCTSCTLDAESVAVLNDKIKFTELCERIGMRVPRAFSVTSRERLLELNSRWRPVGNKVELYGSNVIEQAQSHVISTV